MSRIEIPLKEYNGLKDKIKSLENDLSKATKEASLYKEKYFDLKSVAENLKNETMLSRIFKWKRIISPLSEIVSNEKE